MNYVNFVTTGELCELFAAGVCCGVLAWEIVFHVWGWIKA